MTQRARSGRSTRASAAKLRTVAKVKEPKGQNTDGMNGGNQFSIVAVDRFIQATRDSGYKNTSSAVAELVDNAIQADATRIRITVCHATDGETGAVELLVQDNGTGMDPFTLRTALRFGGTTRFNDRTGLGRYGMGLPNSSLSQARRVTVYTWRTPGEVFMSYLDVDKIAAGDVTEVPTPCRVPPPTGANGRRGTMVVWSRCDRLDNRRISTIARKLLNDLGRQFRYYLTDRVKITVNGDRVEPIDPLYLNPAAKRTGATLFGQPIEYEVQAAEGNGKAAAVGRVRITFSELPVANWHKLSNDEKRRLGISKGAGVSMVRGGREVDYGWFFLGGKRRENYDDWWRCEIQFDPILDEAFGITHTKQQVRPKTYLIETLTPDIEAAAGFPAHAGMDRGHVGRKEDGTRLPRTRGDGPTSGSLLALATTASPHTRGWTLSPPGWAGSKRGFPAHAGMDPRSPASGSAAPRLPRTRGDGPYQAYVGQPEPAASPHTRGWTSGRGHDPGALRGFPAHAGMDPCRCASR